MYPILFLILCAPPPSSGSYLDKAVALSREGSYQASEVEMKKVTDRSHVYHFYKMVNAYKLNNKKESIRWADELINDFSDDVPVRYRDLAVIIKCDVETWADSPESDDLEDISREMTKASDRLKNKLGGPETQKIQQDVLKRLEKMIKDKEDALKAAQEAAEKEIEKEAEQRRSALPPQDTHRGHETGPGKIDQKRVQEIAENWGKLPEKERVKALTELTRNLPPQDKAVVEGYFRELAKTK